MVSGRAVGPGGERKRADGSGLRSRVLQRFQVGDGVIPSSDISERRARPGTIDAVDNRREGSEVHAVLEPPACIRNTCDTPCQAVMCAVGERSAQVARQQLSALAEKAMVGMCFFSSDLAEGGEPCRFLERDDEDGNEMRNWRR